MQYYDRNDISERIDTAKSNNSKKCMIYHYCFFFINQELEFQDYAFNNCHDLAILISVVLFIALAIYEAIIYEKALYLKILDIYKKFSSLVKTFFFTFLL